MVGKFFSATKVAHMRPVDSLLLPEKRQKKIPRTEKNQILYDYIEG